MFLTAFPPAMSRLHANFRGCGSTASVGSLAYQQPGIPAAWQTSSLADPAVLHDSSSDSFAKALEASLSWMIRGYNDLEQVGDMWRSTHGNPPVPALAITVRFDASGPAVVLPQLPPLPQIQPGKCHSAPWPEFR